MRSLPDGDGISPWKRGCSRWQKARPDPEPLRPRAFDNHRPQTDAIRRRDLRDRGYVAPPRELFGYHVTSRRRFGAITRVEWFDHGLVRRIDPTCECRRSLASRIDKDSRNEIFSLYCPAHGTGRLCRPLCNECATSRGSLDRPGRPGGLRARRTHRIEPAGDALYPSCDRVRSHGRPRCGPHARRTRCARCRPEQHDRPLT